MWRCSLCGSRRPVFYCGGCVQRGDFTHSAAHTPERFADKQSKLLNKKDICKIIENNCNKSARYKAYLRRENIIIEINKCRKRTEIINAAIRQKKDKLSRYAENLCAVTESNNLMNLKMPNWKKSVEIIGNEARKSGDKLKKVESAMEIELNALYNLRKLRLDQLVDNVFPVKILNDQSWEHGIPGCTEQAIAEALKPAKISENSINLFPLQILSATLPVGGDYSPYCHWGIVFPYE